MWVARGYGFSLMATKRIPRDDLVRGLGKAARAVTDGTRQRGRVVAQKSSHSLVRTAPYVRKAAASTQAATKIARKRTETAVVAAAPRVKAGAKATGSAMREAANASTPYAKATANYVIDNPDKVVGAITAAAAVSATVAASPFVAPIVAGGTAITAGLKIVSDVRKQANRERGSGQKPELDSPAE
jgi:hypothetical protein